MEQFAHLFNEAEAWDADNVEPAQKAEKKKLRKRRSGSIDDVIPEGTPMEVLQRRQPEAREFALPEVASRLRSGWKSATVSR